MPTSTGSTAFKDQIDAAMVGRLVTALGAADEQFDTAGFRRRATRGLAGLELKARIAQVAAALHATMPEDFARGVAMVDHVLAQPGDGDEPMPSGLNGWDLWPVTDWVVLAGRSQPDEALELLARLTPHATGEFAVRPFIDDDPVGVLDRLERWAASDDEHVRRLVSEGTRPRLPWAPKLRVSTIDPAYAVGLLDRLVDDPSEYVRRSVSNHLNDLCRVDPSLALEVATRWTAWADQAEADGRAERAARLRWVVRRGLRTLVKAGDGSALRLLGHDPDVAVRAELELLTSSVALGGAAEWSLRLVSEDAAAHRVVLDYAIHFVRADGSTGRKVFKWTTVELAPAATVELRRRHRIIPITTRTYRSGAHLLDVQVNGRVVASGVFDLEA